MLEAPDEGREPLFDLLGVGSRQHTQDLPRETPARMRAPRVEAPRVDDVDRRVLRRLVERHVGRVVLIAGHEPEGPMPRRVRPVGGQERRIRAGDPLDREDARQDGFEDHRVVSPTLTSRTRGSGAR